MSTHLPSSPVTLATPVHHDAGVSLVSRYAPTGTSIRFKLGVLATAVTFVLMVGFVSPNLETFQGAERTQPLGGDFLQEWVGGHLVLSGFGNGLYDLDQFKTLQHDSELVGFTWDSQKYFPPVYPPFYYAIVSPFALVSYQTAIWIALLLNGLCLGLLCLLGVGLTGRKPSFAYCCMACLILFTPVILCVTTGQKSLFLLLILSGTYWLLSTKRPLAAGIVFGLIAFKPHLALLIGVAMLLKKQWSFVAGALSMAVLAGLVCLLMGLETCNGFVEICMGMTDYVSSGGYQLTNSHSLWGSFELLFGPLGSGVVKVFVALSGAVLIGFLGWNLRGEIKPNSRRFALQFSSMVIATTLLSPHFYFYDLTILLLPVLLIATALQGFSNRVVVVVNSVSIAFWLLASQFSRIAEWTSIQPSIWLMISMIVCTTIILSRKQYERLNEMALLETNLPLVA